MTGEPKDSEKPGTSEQPSRGWARLIGMSTRSVAPIIGRASPSWAASSSRTTSRDQEFTAFMAQDQAALTRTAWLLVGDEHRAADLVQQALVRTYLAWPRVRDRDPLAYTRKIMANLRIDNWRKTRREVLVERDQLALAAQNDDSDRLVERDRLVRALAVLGSRQRKVVVLRHLEGLSEKEVAALLGVSIGTVKSSASRGLSRLRAELNEEEI